MDRTARRSLSWLLTLASFSVGLTGCGKPILLPVSTKLATPVAAPVVAQPAAGAASGATTLAPTTALESSSAAPDFGDARVGAIVPGSSDTLADSEAPLDAVADGADYALHAPAAVRNQILVAVKASAVASLAHFTVAAGGQSVQDIDVGTHYQVITLPAGMTAEQGMAKYKTASGVTSVLPNRIYGANDTTPDDPYYGKQWGMDQIAAPAGWAQGVDCSNVMVAILDTGIDYRHPEFGNRVYRGWNFADNNDDIMDRFGHGTHVAGIIGAAGNNGIGVAGMAKNVKMLAVKVLSDNGQGSTAAVISGIKYAADAGAKIINMSLGSPDTTVDPAISQAIAYANSRGVIVIAAAGNNHGEVGSPANDPGAIAVSSTSKFLWWEYMSWFSNSGAKIEVAAPGGGIWSTVPLDANQTGSTGYGKLSGTSMAAPMVTGEAALIWAKHPEFSPSQVHYVIDNAVDHKGSAGRNSHYGFGRIDLAKALAY